MRMLQKAPNTTISNALHPAHAPAVVEFLRTTRLGYTSNLTADDGGGGDEERSSGRDGGGGEEGSSGRDGDGGGGVEAVEMDGDGDGDEAHGGSGGG
jgi:hypothetical protein